MGISGDEHAALCLAAAVTDQLGLGRLPGTRSLAGLASDPAVPGLARAYLLGFQPWRLAPDPTGWEDIGSGTHTGPFAGLQRLVAMGAPIQNEALRAYLLWISVAFMAAGADHTTVKFRLDLLERIMMTAAVVPGDAGDSTLGFGRDFLLSIGSAGAFAFTVNHEFGHIDLDARLGAPTDPAPTAADRATTIELIVAALPGMWAAARAQRSAGPDPRRWGAPDGLSVVLAEVEGPLGSYAHMTVEDRAGCVDLDTACRLAVSSLAALSLPPLGAAAAMSNEGVFHLGFPVEHDPAPLSDVAPDVWWQQMADAGRIGTDGDDLQYILGTAPRTTVVFVTTPAVLEDLQADTQLRDASIPPAEQEARLGVAVRCGDAEWAGRLLAGGAAKEPPPLGQLGASCSVTGGPDGLAYWGANPVGLLQVLQALSRAGCDLWRPLPELDGQTLLTDAAGRTRPTTQALLALGAPPDQRDSEGGSALHAAVRYGAIDTVSVLLKAGASVELADGDGFSALHLAARRGDADTLRLLLAGGSPVNAASASGLTPLMGAANAATVTALCAAGADPGAVDTSGETALMALAGRGDQAAVAALLGAGADVNACSDNGLTALHQVVQAPPARRLPTAQTLLSAGADADEERDDGLTPLMGAAGVADPRLLSLLLEHQANPNAATRNGNSALMFACRVEGPAVREPDRSERAVACVQALLAAGAAINGHNASGETALLWATYFTEVPVVRTLLAAGADPNVRSGTGATPLGYARRGPLPGLVDLLIAAGAKESG